MNSTALTKIKIYVISEGGLGWGWGEKVCHMLCFFIQLSVVFSKISSKLATGTKTTSLVSRSTMIPTQLRNASLFKLLSLGFKSPQLLTAEIH